MKRIRNSSLLIGKVITQELQDRISIFPIVAPLGTQGNFAVYQRLNLEAESTKDGYNFVEKTNVAITIVSDRYDEGLNISTDIKMYLEGLRGDYKTKLNEDIIIDDITLIDASEEYNNDKYLQTLVFEISLYNDPYSE